MGPRMEPYIDTIARHLSSVGYARSEPIREVGMDPHLQEQHRTEVIGAYQAAVRLRLYSRISGMAGLVAAVGVLGAMIVGGVGVEEGVTGIVLALLVTVASAAKFYDASYRTGIGASGIERSLDLDEDLSDIVSETREKLITWTTIAAVVGAVGMAAILGLSIANAGTETEDDDDDDDDKTDQTADSFDSGNGVNNGFEFTYLTMKEEST